MEKERTWHVYFINCDCGGHFEARLRVVAETKFMRCQLCKKQIGPLQEREYGSVRALSESEAIVKAKNIKKEKIL
jgi:hypothetical protein